MPVGLRSRSMKIKTEPVEDDASPPVAKRRAQTNVRARIVKKDEEQEEEEGRKLEPLRNVEEIRRKNLEDNKAFLEELLMTKIRDDFKSLTSTLQPAVKKEAKKREFKYITVSENVPVRRSRRLANMDTDGNKLPTPEVSDTEGDGNQGQSVVMTTYRRRTHKRVPDMTPEEQEAINEKIKSIFTQTDPAIEEKKSTCTLSDLNIADENVLKLTPDRLLSVDVHPRSDIVAIVGCDRKGTVGLVVKHVTDLYGTWSKIHFDFHTEYATCCRFDPFQSHCIHSTSYDATLRTCDVTKNLSTVTFKEPNNHGLTWFDYQSEQTLLICEDNGDVIRLDIRAGAGITDRFDVSKKRLRTLHINPLQPEEFCLAGTDHCVKVYDLRNMSSMKYCLQSGYSCYGAFYNHAGSHIMATTRDDHVASFLCNGMKEASDPLDISPLKKIHHRNYVNRFVTPFTAQPFSLFESYFLIGNNGQPRAVTIIDENCKTMNSLSSENLNSLATVNVSHRTLPIVVGGNSSGRIHVFTGQI